MYKNGLYIIIININAKLKTQMRLRILLFFLSLSINSFAYKLIELSFRNSIEQNFKLIEDSICESINYNNVIYKSDYNISSSELHYLIGLSNAGTINSDNIKCIYSRLAQTNKFKSIQIFIEEDSLTIDLESEWTISKIKCISSLSDKELYRSLYLNDAGQIFDETKHDLSIINIKNKLYKNGFCNAEVLSKLKKDDSSKTVEVILNINKASIFKIIDISFKILNTEDIDLIKKITKKYTKIFYNKAINNNYSEEFVNNQVNELRSYLATIGFLNPEIKTSTNIIENNKIHLDIKIILDQRKIFNFIGNTFFNYKELFNMLQLTDNFISILPPELILEDLKNLYKQNGFWDVEITLKKEYDNASKFYFIITEGNRIKIKDISFSEEYKNNSLFNKLLTDSFSNFKNNPDFSDKKLNFALNALKNSFIKNGFWDYSLINKQFINLTENTYKLILDIDPGHQRFINAIKIPNFVELEKHSYFAHFNQTKSPKPFNENLITEQKKWLTDYFIKQKIYISEIRPEIKIESDKSLILIWHITSGKLKFGKTIVTGNKNIPTSIILRELQYDEDQPWSAIKLNNTIKRLKELNVFDSVLLQHNSTEYYEKDKQPVILKCIEDDQFEIRSRFGAQIVNKSFTKFTGTTYKIGGSFIYKNPFKQADIFQIDGDYTRFGYNFIGSYSIPGIYKYPIKTKGMVYANTYEQKFMVPEAEKIYKESHEGLCIENNYYKSYDYSNWRYSLKSGIENMKLSDISSKLAETINFSPILIDKRIAVLYFEPLISIDWIDDKIDPNSGIKTLLSGKTLFPVNVKNAHFIKIFGEQSFYIPLIHSSHHILPKLTLATRFRAGYIFTPDFRRVLPSDRFYLGGPESLRGYEPNMAPPLNTLIKETNRIWVPTGSKSVFNMNTELRFGIYKSLSGVIFNDMGFLSQNIKTDIKLKNILGSTGYGLRCTTPLGMVRFDMGFKWKKRHPDDKIYAWFLALGHAF